VGNRAAGAVGTNNRFLEFAELIPALGIHYSQPRLSFRGAATDWLCHRPVHEGPVCEDGFFCSGNRHLLDDFGIDTDQLGWAHIGFSHDAANDGSPQLGGPFTITGYALQTSDTRMGFPN